MSFDEMSPNLDKPERDVLDDGDWEEDADEYDLLIDLSETDLVKLAKQYIESADRVALMDVIQELRRVHWGDNPVP